MSLLYIMDTYQQPRYKLSILIVCLISAFIVGCSPVIQILTYPEKMYSIFQEEKKLKAAEQAFENGEYQKAGEIYALLIQQSKYPDIRRRSMYGLACVRMTVAETCEDLQKAYDLWTEWRNLAHNIEISLEDPRMYNPFFEKIISGIWLQDQFNRQLLTQDNEKQTNVQQSGTDDIPFQSHPKQIIHEQPIHPEKNNNDENLEKLLHAREKEIRKLKNQIVKMEMDMKVLKERFSALEEIHQEIQEKKRGILP